MTGTSLSRWGFLLPFKLALATLLIFTLIATAPAGQVNMRVILGDETQQIQPVITVDSWWSRDKGQHFAGSLISTVFLGK